MWQWILTYDTKKHNWKTDKLDFNKIKNLVSTKEHFKKKKKTTAKDGIKYVLLRIWEHLEYRKNPSNSITDNPNKKWADRE